MSETTTTYSCGCTTTTVATGTAVAGKISTYCNDHNPYKNVAPKVEVL